jgi:PhnB protein
MAKRSPSEQLDQVVDAIIANGDVMAPQVDREIDPLARLAVELRGLPRKEFKARLKNDLKRRISMTTAEVKGLREGFHTITPYLCVSEAAELIDFVKQAFDAEESFRTIGSAGGIHCEVRIGDSMVMIGGGGAGSGTATPASLMVYVDDVDAVYERALKAGATSAYAPTDQEYGDRDAGVTDRFGNNWYISTKRELEHNPADLHTITPMMSFRGTPQVIDFLKNAFGAEEAYRAESPDGTVVHAKVRIGDSLFALSEAHGPYQPKPAAFYLYVNDVDKWYQRALAGGAESLSEPADQEYGDRVAGVKDSSGNTWYMGTPIEGAS